MAPVLGKHKEDQCSQSKTTRCECCRGKGGNTYFDKYKGAAPENCQQAEQGIIKPLGLGELGRYGWGHYAV